MEAQPVAGPPIRYCIRVRLDGWLADRLKRDWYFKHCAFEESDTGQTVLTLYDERLGRAQELARRWGAAAEVLEPAELRRRMLDELEAMVSAYRRPFERCEEASRAK